MKNKLTMKGLQEQQVKSDLKNVIIDFIFNHITTKVNPEESLDSI